MTIEIFLSDLSDTKRKEVIDAAGRDGNYDEVPLVVLEFEKFEDQNEKRNDELEEKG